MAEEKEQSKVKKVANRKEKCFVIMPFNDPDGYSPGHFLRVYNYILKPAIEQAGYEANRVDLERSTNLIQEKILRELINAPMVLCDLSSRNPNVLFELGIRQAFDKPVVLVKDKITDRIFDISGLTTTDYRSDCIVDEVEEDVKNISQAIIDTKNDNHFNSLIKLIKVNAATIESNVTLKEQSDNDYNVYMLRKIYSMLDDLKDSIKPNSVDNSQSLRTSFYSQFTRLRSSISSEIIKEEIDVNFLSVCKEKVSSLRGFIENNKYNMNVSEEWVHTYFMRLDKLEEDIDLALQKAI